MRRARHAARSLARQSGCGPATVANVALAVSEAVSNAIIHGYAGRTGRIHLRAETDGGDFVITVTDRGDGLTPRPDSPGLGLGLALIAQVTSDLHIDEPPGGGTRVRMAFPRA